MRVLIALLLAASPVFAAVPETGEGTITLLGGVRSILPSNSGYLTEQGAAHQQLQPGGIASFGYQYDDALHFRIDLGYLVDRYRIPGGDLSVRSIPVLIGLDGELAGNARDDDDFKSLRGQHGFDHLIKASPAGAAK